MEMTHHALSVLVWHALQVYHKYHSIEDCPFLRFVTILQKVRIDSNKKFCSRQSAKRKNPRSEDKLNLQALLGRFSKPCPLLMLAKKSANTNDRIAINFMTIFNAGPDVSLSGSPTVSPTTAALCTSDFLNC